MVKKSTRGGKREGAGRPVGEEGRAVTIVASVPESLAVGLDERQPEAMHGFGVVRMVLEIIGERNGLGDLDRAAQDAGDRGDAPIADAGTSRHSFAGVEQRERGDAKNDNRRGGDKPERYEIEEPAHGSPNPACICASLNRQSPDSGSLRDQDRPFGRLEQRQIAHRVRAEA